MSERMAGERFTHMVRGDEAGERLDRLLADLDFMPSRSVAQKLLERGSVRVNGQIATKRHITRPGERISVELPPMEESELVAENVALDIRYEDDDLIVLSKPVGMVVHPAVGHWSGTLVHALLGHSDDLGTLAGEERPGIVHRLDKDTSGLMMVAKNDYAQAALGEAIKVRSIDRRYITLVHGYIAPDSGIVDAPLARSPKDRMRMAVSDHTSAKQAVTTFKVLERFEAGTHDDGFTLLECKLYTGRTHQIRVHMLYIKHPCVGDQVYGPRKPKMDLMLMRQFLHSYKLDLKHPRTGEELAFVEPLPEDLAMPLKSLADRSMGRTRAGDEIVPLLGCG